MLKFRKNVERTPLPPSVACPVRMPNKAVDTTLTLKVLSTQLLRRQNAVPSCIGFDIGSKPVSPDAKGNILALLSNEPYEQLLSHATIKLRRPLRHR